MLHLLLAALCISSLHAETVASDELALRKLNVEITAAEDRGDQKWFEGVLAPEIAFRRSNGTVVGREQFLKGVKARTPSRTEIESVQFHGEYRATVTCVVTLKMDGQDTAFHNVRLFVREAAGWKLLGWANERLGKK